MTPSPSQIILLVVVATLAAEMVNRYTSTQYVRLYEYRYRRGRHVDLEVKVVDGVYECVNLPSGWNDKPMSYDIDITNCLRVYSDPDCYTTDHEIHSSERAAVDFSIAGWDNKVSSISQCCNNRAPSCPGLE